MFNEKVCWSSNSTSGILQKGIKTKHNYNFLLADTLRSRRSIEIYLFSSSALFVLCFNFCLRTHSMPMAVDETIHISEQVWCENCGTIPRTSESDTSVWYVGWLSRRFPCARCHNPFIWGGGPTKAAKRYHVKKLPSGCSLPPALLSPECVRGWRGKSVSVAEIRLKSKTLGIFILHVGLVGGVHAWFKHVCLNILCN